MPIVSFSLDNEKKVKQMKLEMDKKGFKTWIEFDPWNRQFLLYCSKDSVHLSAA